MLLDLNDAESIVSWWSVYPERHGALLADWARRRPEHRAAIAQARRMIHAQPSHRAELHRFQLSQRTVAHDEADLPRPSHDELAAGELEH
ncbi:hypothetical protein [Roseateles amylovorans]|jgi:hypothetical protein|uniref:DUF4880 domain-containing protein n=1 Tax=Roseateles amylovorans TaxID=2978473 RepID=A0ABY6B3G3_9BURK|nr:hypothetical protein [Roseateles amylovorans]UXH79933.1 hypothetical protein N4261_08660 [Roseateles amylovorans]